jgi:predicted nuclease with TOPRIM domain
LNTQILLNKESIEDGNIYLGEEVEKLTKEVTKIKNAKNVLESKMEQFEKNTITEQVKLKENLGKATKNLSANLHCIEENLLSMASLIEKVSENMQISPGWTETAQKLRDDLKDIM